jgi:hypothetical protein
MQCRGKIAAVFKILGSVSNAPAKRKYSMSTGRARENDWQTASLVIVDKALFELLGSLY